MNGCFAIRGLHPLARLWVLIAISLGLALYASALMPALLLLTSLVLLCERPDHRTLLRALRRIRWLLLATVLLHAYLTPGPLLWPALGMLSPAREGLLEGLMRAWVLLFIGFWAIWLMHGVTPKFMAQALARLLRPLGPLGFPVERLASRLSLTLEAVDSMGARARELRRILVIERAPAGLREGLQLRAQVLLQLFEELEDSPPPSESEPATPLPPLACRDRMVLLVVLTLLGLNLAFNVFQG